MVFQFQIFLKQRGAESGTNFKVFCPGQYKTYPHKLKMYNNGSVSNNIKYHYICNISNFVVNFAFPASVGAFNVFPNNTIEEWHDYVGLRIDSTAIPWDWEIIKTFIQNNKIAYVNWIDTNSTDIGFFSNKTGNWTGLIGKVNNY